MAVERTISSENDGSEMFPDGTSSSISNNNEQTTVTNVTVNKPNSIETSFGDIQENDALLADNEGTFTNVPLSTVISGATDLTQGYYGLLSSFYFDGNPTSTEIPVSGINTWTDVLLSVDGNGTFDKRPKAMRDAFPQAVDGDGSQGNPIVFSLEGLDINAFANFRASMSFEPDEDEGELESRLLFNRHSGTSPSSDFSIEEVSLSMQSGANRDYVTEPLLTFFVGDTIDTNASSDAGKCRFQIKSNVAGTLKLRALTWYINK